MAGLSECCSHAAATLFAVETAVRMAQGLTCTDVECKWMKATSKKIQYSELADIDFTGPKQKKLMSEVDGEPSKLQKIAKDVPLPSDEDKQAFYKSLADSGVRCAVLSILPEYCNRYTPESVSRDIPPPLSSLHRAVYDCLSEEEI